MQKGFSLTLLGVKKVELVNILFVLLLSYLGDVCVLGVIQIHFL